MSFSLSFPPIYQKLLFFHPLSVVCLFILLICFPLCTPGQDESALSQSLSLLNSMSSAIYFHSPSFACSFLLALCSACVCARLRADGSERGWVGGWGERGSGRVVGWWFLSRSSCAVRTDPSSCWEIRDSGAHGRLLLPVPAPPGCLSSLLALPASYFQHRIACTWHFAPLLAGEMFRLLMSVQRRCRIDVSEAARRNHSSPPGAVLAVVTSV